MRKRKAKQNNQLTPGWALYERTSSAYSQAPERSQEMQRNWIDPVVRSTDLPIVKEYIDVVSGTTINRKAYLELLDDAERGLFSHLVVSHVDRFGRNAGEALVALNRLKELGITVRIATNPTLDINSIDGQLVLTILFGMAEAESKRIGQRVKGSQMVKLQKGSWPWKAPDGYLNKEEKL